MDLGLRLQRPELRALRRRLPASAAGDAGAGEGRSQDGRGARATCRQEGRHSNRPAGPSNRSSGRRAEVCGLPARPRRPILGSYQSRCWGQREPGSDAQVLGLQRCQHLRARGQSAKCQASYRLQAFPVAAAP
ncbi:unnamed protein product [Symbiodinium natans]|uniref:Uncharacterized protein n=1 Tax=Symbiodinium natans TaxID=878477 RepID=A0A812H2I2_9DINO|nr:unnamed protein product [Symbiodinium natans]